MKSNSPQCQAGQNSVVSATMNVEPPLTCGMEAYCMTGSKSNGSDVIGSKSYGCFRVGCFLLFIFMVIAFYEFL
jgi:hypothetical protein